MSTFFILSPAHAEDTTLAEIAQPDPLPEIAEDSDSLPPGPATIEDTLAQLTDNSFKKKETAIETLSNFDDDRVLAIFRNMLNGDLYYRKQDKRLLLTTSSSRGYQAQDALTLESYGDIDKSDIKKVAVNNKLRRILRGEIARLSLSNKNASVRETAVKEMYKSIDEETAELLRNRLAIEQDSDVATAINIGIALHESTFDDNAIRLSAIKTLGLSLDNEAHNRLTEIVRKDENGNFIEQDEKITKAALSALNTINTKRDFYSLIQTIFFGLSLGSVLLLAAIGLAITFGVMGVINMAHGELIMLGAYTTYIIQQLMPDNIGISLFIAIPAAFMVSGLVGIAIERGVIRHLYGRPLDTLLATFGISLILQQAVRVGISAQNVSVETPSWMSGTLDINPALALTYNRLYILLFGVMVFFALMMILKKTSLGLQVRAVSQNRSMAKAMGVRTEWVDALTFGLGSGIAGVAGVALSQITNVGPNLGQSYIIDSFMVVVFGGVGNLWGTLVGAMSLGVVNKFLEPWAGAVLAKILVLVFIILFIQKKPRGLFPQKGRAAEN